MVNISCVQLAHGTIKDLPMPLHHRTALLAALAKSIAEGWRTTGSATDRAAAAAALEAFVPRTLAVMNPDAELNGFQADAPLERGALRLAAADALLKVGSRLDKELPGQAFVEMGLVMQDELVEVCPFLIECLHYQSFCCHNDFFFWVRCENEAERTCLCVGISAFGA